MLVRRGGLRYWPNFQGNALLYRQECARPIVSLWGSGFELGFGIARSLFRLRQCVHKPLPAPFERVILYFHLAQTGRRFLRSRSREGNQTSLKPLTRLLGMFLMPLRLCSSMKGDRESRLQFLQ